MPLGGKPIEGAVRTGDPIDSGHPEDYSRANDQSLDARTAREAWARCPLWEPDDKWGEAGYFLKRMMEDYHSPDQFRWNLNAFLQSLRNVTFILQNTLSDHHGFRGWYAGQQEEMRQDQLLRKFVEGRNVVVKQRNLYVKSSADVGMYRYRKLKLAVIAVQVPVHTSSQYVLTELAPKMNLLDEEHMAIGEEYGVRRTWLVEELGEGNVLDLCNQAWHRIGGVLDAAHQFLGMESPGQELPQFRSSECDLLTETDLDPTLPEKWGWS